MTKHITALNVPRIQSTSVDGVKNWIAELQVQGLMWHMDDSVHDMAFQDDVDGDARIVLAGEQTLAVSICDHSGVDIHLYTLQALKVGNPYKDWTFKNFIESRRIEMGPIVEDLGWGADFDSQYVIYGAYKTADHDFYDFDYEKLPLCYIRRLPPLHGSTWGSMTLSDQTTHDYDGCYELKMVTTHGDRYSKRCATLQPLEQSLWTGYFKNQIDLAPFFTSFRPA